MCIYRHIYTCEKVFTKTQTLDLIWALQAHFLEWRLMCFGKELFISNILYIFAKYAIGSALYISKIQLYVMYNDLCQYKYQKVHPTRLYILPPWLCTKPNWWRHHGAHPQYPISTQALSHCVTKLTQILILSPLCFICLP